jgi:hypothetical protein
MENVLWRISCTPFEIRNSTLATFIHYARSMWPQRLSSGAGAFGAGQTEMRKPQSPAGNCSAADIGFFSRGGETHKPQPSSNQ